MSSPWERRATHHSLLIIVLFDSWKEFNCLLNLILIFRMNSDCPKTSWVHHHILATHFRYFEILLKRLLILWGLITIVETSSMGVRLHWHPRTLTSPCSHLLLWGNCRWSRSEMKGTRAIVALQYFHVRVRFLISIVHLAIAINLLLILKSFFVQDSWLLLVYILPKSPLIFRYIHEGAGFRSLQDN